MKRFLPLSVLLLIAQCFGQVQPTADVLGVHNLSRASGASIYSQGSLACTFCHAPHSGLRRKYSSVESEVISEIVRPVYKHDRYQPGKYATDARCHQQPLPELS